MNLFEVFLPGGLLKAAGFWPMMTPAPPVSTDNQIRAAAERLGMSVSPANIPADPVATPVPPTAQLVPPTAQLAPPIESKPADSSTVRPKPKPPSAGKLLNKNLAWAKHNPWPAAGVGAVGTAGALGTILGSRYLLNQLLGDK